MSIAGLRWLAVAFERAARRLSVPLDPDARAMVRAEQLRMVWGHSRVGIIVASVFAVMLAAFASGAMDARLVRIWLAIKLAIALWRVVQSRKFQRQGEAGDTRRWERTTLVSLAIDALVWGVAGWWFAGGPVTIASASAAALAGVASVATFGLQVSFPATLAYVTPILLPTSAGMLLRADDVGVIGGIGLLLFLGLQLATARRAEQRLTSSLLLGLEAQELAAAKNAALELALRQSAVRVQFLASVSHELRTPLHGILGIARLLHMESEDPRVIGRVELIEASGTHLLSIINDLLDISRLEAGRFSMRSERFELTGQLDNVVATHEVRAEDHGLRLRAEVRVDRPCWVSGDPARFRQVLHNLIGNAVKFTQQGSVMVTLDRIGRDMVRVQVSDTGPGIAAADLARIFEAFTQSDEALTRPAEGVGLGLAIAREIARAMGGDVVVQSTVGVGSTLTFTAQLPPAEVHADQVETHRAEPSVTVGPDTRVLVAEDDETNALIAIAFLERIGATVERVADGRGAVRRALREFDRPDLVLMDCRMPVMDGYAATREIRAQELALALPRLPVVALTATMTDADRQLCMDAGMDDFLAKPYKLEQLAQVLGRWIGRGAASGSERQGVAKVQVGVDGPDHEGVQRVT